MAIIQIDVPDPIIPDLTQALALRLAESPDAAVKAVALKALAGQTTTGAEKQALARSFMKEAAKVALLDYRAQQAAQAARETDAAREW